MSTNELYIIYDHSWIFTDIRVWLLRPCGANANYTHFTDFAFSTNYIRGIGIEQTIKQPTASQSIIKILEYMCSR